MNLSRREFLKNMVYGSIPLIVGATYLPKALYGAAQQEGQSTVSFVAGSDRRQNIIAVLSPLKDVVSKAIHNKNIIIKPNCVVDRVPLCATHVDALRGVLDFFSKITDQKIIIAESSAINTPKCYSEYGYLALAKEYKNVELVDLNAAQYQKMDGIVDANNKTRSINITSFFMDSLNYIVSICRMKTHDTVVATLTVKNLIMAAPTQNYKISEDKVVMHGGTWGGATSATLTKNMFLLANKFLPHLAILDGYENMEGCGPAGNDGPIYPVEHKVALAGTDSIAVDRVALELMGIPANYAQYLKWCGNAGLGNYDWNKIAILGPAVESYKKPYKLHPNLSLQLEWIEELKPLPSKKNAMRTVKPYFDVMADITPLRPATEIAFSIPFAMPVYLGVSDQKGRRIRTLIADHLEAGKYKATWEGRDEYGSHVSNGRYSISLHTDSASLSKTVAVYR
jgi:uncharacterized protein (DUF362 family)